MVNRATVPEGKSLFFRRTDNPEETSVTEGEEKQTSPTKKTRQQRKAVPKPPTRQSAIWLTEKQIDWLEEKCREARKNGGRAIKRAAIVRALLNVAMEASVDLRGLSREEELDERIKDAVVQLQ